MYINIYRGLQSNIPGDAAVQDLIDNIREHVPAMFKVCEAIAMLDMISAFAQLVTSQDYGK